MSALQNLLAAAEQAAENSEPESGHVINNGLTRRDYVSGEVETIRETEPQGAETGRYVGTFEDSETGAPGDVYADSDGLLYAADPEPEHQAQAAAIIETDYQEAETRTLAAMAAGHDVALPGAPDPEPELIQVEGPTGRAVAIEPEPQDSEAEGVPYHIREEYHNRRRFTYYQVTLGERVDRELFNEIRAACILAGGWYSRPWAGEPGGFAFRSLETAQEFGNEHLGAPSGPQGPGPGAREPVQQTEHQAPPPAPVRGHANKLRTLADTMQGAIDDKLGERLENTPKRQAQAARARQEGHQLQRAQSVMRRLADLWDAGQVPAILEDVHTKAAIVGHMACALEDVPNGYHAYKVEAYPVHARGDDPATAALWALYEADPEAESAQILREAIVQVRGRTIPGYFWTEGEARELVHQAADIHPWSRVLEPSAGDGALLEGLPIDTEAGGLVMVCEIQPDLCDVLKERGYDARPADFLAVHAPEAGSFDRIIMNPPFERLQDIDHVRHAWEFLAESGRLVAIMSPGWTFHDNQKARDFRDWVEELGGEWEELPAGSFRHAGTSVNTGMLTLRK